MRLGIVGSDSDRLAKAALGLLQPPQLTENIAAIVMGLRVMRAPPGESCVQLLRMLQVPQRDAGLLRAAA